MTRRRQQADHRADTRGGGFVGIPHAVIVSSAYRMLTPFARAVLIEIIARFNGYNNGSIAISQREIAHALTTTNFRRIGAALAELLTHGLIDVEATGGWKQRQAREYRLTFVSTGKGAHTRPATNDYGHFCADDPSAGESQSAEPPSAERGIAAEASSAAAKREARKTVDPDFRAADDPSALIGKPYPSGTASPGYVLARTRACAEDAATRVRFIAWADEHYPGDIDRACQCIATWRRLPTATVARWASGTGSLAIADVRGIGEQLDQFAA